MYVKIIVKDGVDTIFDCDEFQLERRFIDENAVSADKSPVMADMIIFTVTKGEDQSTHEFKKFGTEIYLMNDSGRTIDTYQWPLPQTEIIRGFDRVEVISNGGTVTSATYAGNDL